MTAEFTPASVGLFLLVVFPGLVSIAVYRLIMPARTMDWGTGLFQGLFYSAINLVLASPVLYLLIFGFDPLQHPVRYLVAAAIVLLLLPAIWPLLLSRSFKSRWIAHFVQIPYPTAWDFFFDQRQPAFMLVHLPSGSLLGGYYGGNSYAGSYPNDGDIYLQAVYTVDSQGIFGAPIANSRGVLLRKEQYSYIELFSVPTPATIRYEEE